MNKVIKHFQTYTHEQRADMRSSHRLGYRQKQRAGEVFWTHPDVPGLAFPSKRRAEEAAAARTAMKPAQAA